MTPSNDRDENHALRNQVQELLLQVDTLRNDKAELLQQVEELIEDLEALEPIIKTASPDFWELTYHPTTGGLRSLQVPGQS